MENVNILSLSKICHFFIFSGFLPVFLLFLLEKIDNFIFSLYNFRMNNIYHLNKIYFEPIRIGNIELTQIGRLYCSSGGVIPTHVQKQWIELTIVTDGKGEVFTNDVGIPVKSGDIYLSFPADTHKIVSSVDEPLRYDFLSFYPTEEKYLQAIEEIISTFYNPHDRLFSDEKIKLLVANAIAEFCEENACFSNEVLTNIFQQITVYLIRAFQTKKVSVPFPSVHATEILCYQVMHYVDTHIFSLKNLQTLSRFTNYNYSYLSTLFKKTTGRTLFEYYQDSKLKTAKCMLGENKMKIGEIAEQLNYSSVYAFSKAYKKKYGISPSIDKKK